MTAEQLTAEQLRTLDAEVHGEVMGTKWFRVRYDGRERPEWGFESVHLLSADVAARYPNEGWSAQALSPEEGLTAFLAHNPKAYQQQVMLNIPRYSTDIAAAWEMEEELQRRGLGTEYGMELMALVVTPETETGQKPFTFAFDTAHASPELRCRAALLTVRGALAASCLAEAGRCKPHIRRVNAGLRRIKAKIEDIIETQRKEATP